MWSSSLQTSNTTQLKGQQSAVTLKHIWLSVMAVCMLKCTSILFGAGLSFLLKSIVTAVCVFVLCRAARGNGIRSGYPWHRHIRAADDVHHDPAYCVLHSLGVWRRHYANAVLATYQVRVQETWSVPYLTNF